MPQNLDEVWPPFGLLVVTADALRRPGYKLQVRGARPMQEFLGLIHNQDLAESDVGSLLS